MNQQGDVLLCQTPDNGEVEIIDGIVTMDGGLDTAAYLSLFGGNYDDNSGFDTTLQWWGNIGESDQSRGYRSETQFLLHSIPATSFNLLRIEDAVKNDLNWLLTEKIATELQVSVSIPNLNKVNITVNINAIGSPKEISFYENWKTNIT